VNRLQIADRGNFVVAAGNREEEMIARGDTAVEENIGVGIEHLAVQRTEVVENKTVGKLPQVVYTALERMIHIPHLVIRHKWLVEEEKARHSGKESATVMCLG
jgi:hypothetical protein